jgi:DNA-binding transcriptional LysR family regulator
MIDLRHVRHLLAVASHRTVQAAADAIHLTQPALTKSIGRFEEELGVELFERQGRRLVLTEFGERLVERGEDLLRNVRDLEEEVALWKGVGIGEVTIGADPEAELGLLPGVLEAFVPAHPGVRVTVRSGHTDTLMPALLRGELHFLVADAEIAQGHDALEIRALSAAQLVAALRPGHPLAFEALPEPAAVKAFPFIGASTAPRFERWTADQAREPGGPVAPSLVCDSYEVLVRLAETSDAILLGPWSVLSFYERAGRIQVVPWPIDGPDAQPSLIRSKGRVLSPAAARLIELVEREGLHRRERSD